MKCVKDECQFYSQHQFRGSYGTCNLTDSSFIKDYDIDCMIDIAIKDMDREMNILKQEKENIIKINKY